MEDRCLIYEAPYWAIARHLIDLYIATLHHPLKYMVNTSAAVWQVQVSCMGGTGTGILCYPACRNELLTGGCELLRKRAIQMISSDDIGRWWMVQSPLLQSFEVATCPESIESNLREVLQGIELPRERREWSATHEGLSDGVDAVVDVVEDYPVRYCEAI